MDSLERFNNVQTIESREVAKMIGRRHDHLVRDIQGYVNDLGQNPDLGADGFFIKSSYKAGTGKTYPCYLLTKKGCEFVANKMTGKKGNLFTASYITKFNKMEKQQISVQFEIPQSYSEALRLAADQQDQLEKQKPIVEYTKTMLLNPGLETTTAIAKNYGMGAKKFNNLLHELGIQYRQGKTWFLYAKYQDKGYTHVEPFGYVDSDGMDQIRNTSKWTQKGQEFIYQKLKEVGISPTIEDNEEA